MIRTSMKGTTCLTEGIENGLGVSGTAKFTYCCRAGNLCSLLVKDS
jgi:hypothetical protein